KPDFLKAYQARAGLLRDMRRMDEALACYDQALALSPDNAELHKDRALTLAEMNHQADALAAYDKAMALDPEFPFLIGFRWGAKVALCDWTNLETDRDALLAAVAKGALATP